MPLSDDQLALWRKIHPEGFRGDADDPQHVGGFIHACVFDGLGEPSADDVRAQIKADGESGPR